MEEEDCILLPEITHLFSKHKDRPLLTNVPQESSNIFDCAHTVLRTLPFSKQQGLLITVW